MARGHRAARPAFVAHPVEFEQVIARGAGTAHAGGWRSGVVHAHKRFDLVGLSWRAPRAVDARIRVRDASSGAWSPWTPMAGDHDGGGGTEPVWAGGADAFELRLRRYPRDLRARFVNSTGSATAARRVLTALRRTAHDALGALAGAQARAQDGSGAPAIVPREAWGAEQCGAPRTDPSYGIVQVGVVHHTVNANDYRPQDSAAIVRAICRYHRDVKGWHDIGYNFLVDRFGQVFEGRAGGIDQAVIGAHAQGYNAVSTGVANIGTFSGIAPTAAAVHATERLLAWKLSLHGVPAQGSVTVLSGGGPSNRYAAGTAVTLQRISGHRDLDSTDCPGGALYGQLAEIRRGAAQLALEYPAPAPAAAVTLGAAAGTVAFPQAAQLSGRVTGAGGAPLAGAAVSIQIATRSGFVPRGHAVSGADGTWAAELPTQYTRTLRAVARLPAGGVATSPLLAVHVVPRIGVLAPTRVVARRAFTISASVRPLRTDLDAVLARKGPDGAFHTVGRVALKATSGAFRRAVVVRRPALYRLRIESRSDARNLAGRSRDVVLRAVRPRR
ncbi:MAG: hypothetical protein QOJ63_2649 [Solirubrobacteraceae bacterium]|nr:hypothetical protein [Solirubrobacteraceae bacterium]